MSRITVISSNKSYNKQMVKKHYKNYSLAHTVEKIKKRLSVVSLIPLGAFNSTHISNFLHWSEIFFYISLYEGFHLSCKNM